MVTKFFEDKVSDEKIKEKMLKHSKTAGSADRDLIRVRIPNGHGDKAENHEIFALHGSPIKGFAVRKRNKLYMYESDGTRWATYQLANSQDPIKYEISKTKEDLREQWAQSRIRNSNINIENEVLEDLKSQTSLVDHAIDPKEIINEISTELDIENVESKIAPANAPKEIQSEVNILNKITSLKEDGYNPFKILRPYDANSDEINDLADICEKYGCEYWILGATNYLKDAEDYREMTFTIILASQEE